MTVLAGLIAAPLAALAAVLVTLAFAAAQPLGVELDYTLYMLRDWFMVATLHALPVTAVAFPLIGSRVESSGRMFLADAAVCALYAALLMALNPPLRPVRLADVVVLTIAALVGAVVARLIQLGFVRRWRGRAWSRASFDFAFAGVLAACLFLATGSMQALLDELNHSRQPGWLERAAQKVPDRFRTGDLHRYDAVTMTAWFAAYEADEDLPGAPPSAFDPGYLAVVRVKPSEVASEPAVLLEMKRRLPGDEPAFPGEKQHRVLLAELDAARRDLPEGVEPCRIGGWTLNNDPQGAPVRAEPHFRAAVRDRLSAPFVPDVAVPSLPGGIRTEFDIIGYKDGWFLIENARRHVSAYLSEAGRQHDVFHDGRGWISAGEVGGTVADTGMPLATLLQSPHVDAGAAASELERKVRPPVTQRAIRSIRACSANWAKVEDDHDGYGWWRGICSDQRGNCARDRP